MEAVVGELEILASLVPPQGAGSPEIFTYVAQIDRLKLTLKMPHSREGILERAKKFKKQIRQEGNGCTDNFNECAAQTNLKISYRRPPYSSNIAWEFREAQELENLKSYCDLYGRGYYE